MSRSAHLPPGARFEAGQLIALRQVMLHAQAPPMLAALPGGFATRRKGAGMELADVREYAPGDDIRHFDHAVTARTGRPHVRQFQQDRDRITLLVADLRPSMIWGLKRAFRSVAAAEVASLIGWHVVENGGRAGLLAITARGPVVVPPRPRVRGMLDVIAGLVEAHEAALTALLEAPAIEEPPLDLALARVDRLAVPGSEVVIISGFDAEGGGLADRLSDLSRRRRISLVRITAAEAGRLPAGRYPVRLSDGRRLRLYLGGKAPSSTDQLVAGRQPVFVDAGAAIEVTAAKLAGSPNTRTAA